MKPPEIHGKSPQRTYSGDVDLVVYSEYGFTLIRLCRPNLQNSNFEQLKIIQGHRCWCQSKANMQLPTNN